LKKFERQKGKRSRGTGRRKRVRAALKKETADPARRPQTYRDICPFFVQGGLGRRKGEPELERRSERLGPEEFSGFEFVLVGQ
jgi:hypothetical protein